MDIFTKRLNCSDVLAFFALLALHFSLATGKPGVVGEIAAASCGGVPPQQPTDDTVQSFRNNNETDIFYCRKLLDDAKTQFIAYEIVRQKTSTRSDTLDFIEVSDCKSYYYILYIDPACKFQLDGPNCVKVCRKNDPCPSEAAICSANLRFRRFEPEMDLDENHATMYNVDNRLVTHCECNLENELPLADTCNLQPSELVRDSWDDDFECDKTRG